MPGGKHWSRSPSECRGCSRSVGEGSAQAHELGSASQERLYGRSLTSRDLGPSVDLGVASTWRLGDWSG